MGWLLELLKDIYSNEVNYCMKPALKAEKQVRHLNPCDLYTCWQWKPWISLSRLRYFLSSFHSFQRCNLQGVIQVLLLFYMPNMHILPPCCEIFRHMVEKKVLYCIHIKYVDRCFKQWLYTPIFNLISILCSALNINFFY